MCTANVRNTPIHEMPSNSIRVRACNFKNFPGEHAPNLLAIACPACWLRYSDLPDQCCVAHDQVNLFPPHAQ